MSAPHLPVTHSLHSRCDRSVPLFDDPRAPHRPCLVFGPATRRHWQEVDWRSHQRWVEVDGTPVNTIELGPDDDRGAQPLVFVHGLSGSWPNWLEQLPAFAAHTPGHRTRSARLRAFPDAGAERHLDLRLRTDARATARPSSASTPPPLSATRWAASSPPSSRSPIPSASSGSCSSRPPGSLPTTTAAPRRVLPAMRHIERSLAAVTAWTAAQVRHRRTTRPRLRNATLNLVVRHPSRLRFRTRGRAAARRRQARLHAGPRGRAALRRPRAPAGDRLSRR